MKDTWETNLTESFMGKKQLLGRLNIIKNGITKGEHVFVVSIVGTKVVSFGDINEPVLIELKELLSRLHEEFKLQSTNQVAYT